MQPLRGKNRAGMPVFTPKGLHHSAQGRVLAHPVRRTNNEKIDPPMFSTRLTILVLLIVAAPLGACNVPVFRYALEHWPTEPFRVTVYHQGPLATEVVAQLDALEQTPGTHLTIRTVDVAREKIDNAPDQLPCVEVRCAATTWRGSLDEL